MCYNLISWLLTTKCCKKLFPPRHQNLDEGQEQQPNILEVPGEDAQLRDSILNDSIPLIDSNVQPNICLLYTSPSPRDATLSRMPSSA